MPDAAEPTVPSAAHARPGAGWWGRTARLHRDVALRHQWEQLAHHGAIEAFEVAAGRSDVVPTVGVVAFTSDSDVHKWLDAVARSIPAGVPDDVAAIQIVRGIRELTRATSILVRCRFQQSQATLKQMGANAVVSEEAEASQRLLEWCEHAALDPDGPAAM